LDKGVILATKRQSVERGNETTTYALRFKAKSSDENPVVVVAQFHDETRGSSMVKPALVAPRNPQETGEQQTAIESSKGEIPEIERRGEAVKPDHSRSHYRQTDALVVDGSLGAILQHRVRRDAGREDCAAISTAIERFAADLGDQAPPKASVSRALNLFQASGITRDVFIDLLFRAEGEVTDRRFYPGNAPIPRNQMAYFFAVVEDRLGLRERVD
jgi:hypothetical protein